ncbi:MAG: hypothetical protein ACXVFK_13165 [Solirubrobacteraceae bacterium]
MAGEQRSRNPLRSEDAAFRMLLWVAGIVVVLMVLVLVGRAIF